MNIGVHLEHMPVSHSWWIVPSGIEYNNKTYWIAECTALADWTVGSRPEILANDKPIIIPLQNYENKSAASISSSLNVPLQSSSTSINLSIGYSNVSNYGRVLNISGSISSFSPGGKIAVYISHPGYSPTAYTPAVDQFGSYTLTWNVTSFGTYSVRTSWSGSANYSGSDSETITVFFNSQSWEYPPEFLALLSIGNTEFLKSNLTGKDVVFSGEFMVLSNGQDEPANDTIIVIPAHQQIFRWPRSRQMIILDIPEETITIPGIRNQFGFVLERTAEDNYTASVKLLTDNDISQMPQSLDKRGRMFMNASLLTARNEWHKAITKVSRDNASIKLYNANGTQLQNLDSSTATTDFEELGIFMTYGPSQVLAFKNLKVETITQNQVPVSDDKVKENGIEILYSLMRTSFLLAGAALAVVTLKGRKKNSVL